MRRLLVLVIGVGLGWVGTAEPAGACSCAAPPPTDVEFDGTAIDVEPADFGSRWTFQVDEVHEGEVGDEVEVVIDAGRGSSCSIGQTIELDAQYRVAVHTPEEGFPLTVNLCGGSVELLAASSPAAPPADDPPYALYVAGALAAVTVLGVLLARR